jgi:hypothetical protein
VICAQVKGSYLRDHEYIRVLCAVLYADAEQLARPKVEFREKLCGVVWLCWKQRSRLW